MLGYKGLRDTSYRAFFMTETILNHQHTLQAIKSHSKEPDKKIILTKLRQLKKKITEEKVFEDPAKFKKKTTELQSRLRAPCPYPIFWSYILALRPEKSKSMTSLFPCLMTGILQKSQVQTLNLTYNLQPFHCFHFTSIAIIIPRMEGNFTDPLSVVPLQKS